jgi:hypothetical protein
MAYASRAGRAKTSARNPQAHAICDRCGFRYNHVALSWQFDYAGATIVNKRMLVCNTCYDEPNPQLRAIVIPADPVPIQNPRVENFAAAASNTRVTSGQNTIDPVTGLPIIGGNTRVTEDGATRVTQQTGEPPYGLNEQPGTSIDVPDDLGGLSPGLPYGNTSVPKTGPL